MPSQAVPTIPQSPRRDLKGTFHRPTPGTRPVIGLQSREGRGLAMVTNGIIHLETDYAEIARRPLEAEQCALIVVDIQSKLLPPIWEKERLLRKSQLLIQLAVSLSTPTTVITQYAQVLG